MTRTPFLPIMTSFGTAIWHYNPGQNNPTGTSRVGELYNQTQWSNGNPLWRNDKFTKFCGTDEQWLIGSRWGIDEPLKHTDDGWALCCGAGGPPIRITYSDFTIDSVVHSIDTSSFTSDVCSHATEQETVILDTVIKSDAEMTIDVACHITDGSDHDIDTALHTIAESTFDTDTSLVEFVSYFLVDTALHTVEESSFETDTAGWTPFVPGPPVWVDTFNDVDGEVLENHTPDLSPGGAGYSHVPGGYTFFVTSNTLQTYFTNAAYRLDPGLTEAQATIDFMFSSAGAGLTAQFYLSPRVLPGVTDGTRVVVSWDGVSAWALNIYDNLALSDSVSLSLSPDTWYTLTVTNTSSQVYATIGSDMASITSAVDAGNTIWLLKHEQNSFSAIFLDNLSIG